MTSCFIIYLNHRPKGRKIPSKTTLLISVTSDTKAKASLSIPWMHRSPALRYCFFISYKHSCCTGVYSPLHLSPKYCHFCTMRGHLPLRVQLRERSVSVTSGVRHLSRVVREVNGIVSGICNDEPFETVGTWPLSVRREYGFQQEILCRLNDWCGMPVPAVCHHHCVKERLEIFKAGSRFLPFLA